TAAISANYFGEKVVLGVVIGNSPVKQVAVTLGPANPFPAGECLYGGPTFDIDAEEIPRKGLRVVRAFSNAHAAGLREGDLLVAIESKNATWEWMNKVEEEHGGDPETPVKITFED